MTNEKMTKKQVVEMMLREEVILCNELYKNYLEHELELLSKKRTRSNAKPTAKQEENASLQEDILLWMENQKKGLTAGEIGETFGCSASKSSSMLNQMISKGMITKTEKVMWHNPKTDKNERKTLFHTLDITYTKSE